MNEMKRWDWEKPVAANVGAAATEAEVVESAESGQKPVATNVPAGIHVAPQVGTWAPSPEVIAVVRNDKLNLKEKLERLRHLMPPVHPAADMYPLMTDKETIDLAEDIKTNGQRFPILLTDGGIFDGRNRWLACVLGEVAPQTAQWDKQGDPIEVIKSLNLKRRQLAPLQLAVLAVQLEPHFAALAKERMKEGGGDKKSAKVKSGGSALEPPDRQRDNAKRALVRAAKSVGAPLSATQAMKRIMTTANDVFELAKDGKTNLAQVKWLAALPEPERKEAVARIQGGAKPVKPTRLRKPSPPVSETALDLLDRAETLIQQAAQQGAKPAKPPASHPRNDSSQAPGGSMASHAKQVVMILGEMRSLVQTKEPGAPDKPVPAVGSAAPVATATVKTGSSKTRSTKTGSSKTRSAKTGTSKAR